jgi:hypothetical protein
MAHALKHRGDIEVSLVRRKKWQRSLTITGIVALPVAAVLIGRELLRNPRLDASRVVVFPFPDRNARGDSLSFSTDVPYAIELALDHSAPLRWVHGWNWIDESVRRDPLRLTGPRMRNLARDLQARYYIDGAIQRSAQRTQLVLQLHDALSDSTLITEGLTGDAAADLPALAVQAVSKLLLRWLTPGRHEALADLASRHPGAVALQVQGEHEYRRARFSQALALFERSVALDTTWGYAAVKAAQAASWLSRRDDGLRHIQLALRHRESLPRQYSEFAQGLEAYLQGSGDAAVESFRRSIALAPAWEEAHMALGEVYYHLLPSRGDPQALAQAGFEAALAADSNFVPAARHLAEIAFRNGDLDRGDQLWRRINAAQADSETTRTLTIMHDCLRGRGSDAAWRELAQHDPLSVLGAAQQLGAGAAKVACAERLYRVLLTSGALPEGYPWRALRGLQGLMLTTGRSDQAVRLLDSALNAGAGAVRFLYLLESGEAEQLQSRAKETADFARANYGARYEGAAPLTQWALAVWHARQGDSAIVSHMGGDSARVTSATEPRVRRLRDAIAAHAALARRDSGQAISLLQGLRPNARIEDLDDDLFEPLAVERLTLGELLLTRDRYQEAHDAVLAFDNVNLAFTPFVARSVAIRARAMAALGDAKAADYRRRLSALGRADLLGQRR